MPYRTLAAMERHYPTSRYAVLARYLADEPTYHPCHNFESALTLAKGQDATILERAGGTWFAISQRRA